MADRETGSSGESRAPGALEPQSCSGCLIACEAQARHQIRTHTCRRCLIVVVPCCCTGRAGSTIVFVLRLPQHHKQPHLESGGVRVGRQLKGEWRGGASKARMLLRDQSIGLIHQLSLCHVDSCQSGTLSGFLAASWYPQCEGRGRATKLVEIAARCVPVTNHSRGIPELCHRKRDELGNAQRA